MKGYITEVHLATTFFLIIIQQAMYQVGSLYFKARTKFGNNKWFLDGFMFLFFFQYRLNIPILTITLNLWK